MEIAQQVISMQPVKMQHSNSGAVVSIPRIVGRDHVCVARNKTNILRNNKMLDDGLTSITTIPEKRVRNTLIKSL